VENNLTAIAVSNARALVELIASRPELGQVDEIAVSGHSWYPNSVAISSSDPNRASALRAWGTLLSNPRFTSFGEDRVFVRLEGSYGPMLIQVRSVWSSDADRELIANIPLGFDLLDELAGRAALTTSAL